MRGRKGKNRQGRCIIPSLIGENEKKEKKRLGAHKKSEEEGEANKKEYTHAKTSTKEEVFRI
jgi:hypothetical protein